MIRGRSDVTLELPADATVDVERAFDEIQRAESALEGIHWETARRAAAATLQIIDRGFLPEVEAPWVHDERRRLEELRLRALECLAAAGLGLGGARLSDTERAARMLVAAAPYRETGYRYLMQALAERGRVAEALRVFENVRLLLQEELGAPPGAGLRSLHAQLLSEHGVAAQTAREDPLAVGSGAMAATPTPFALPLSCPGSERDVFVGRESDLERLWRLYERTRSGTRHVILLRGAPGIGKTRLATELALRAHADGAVFMYGSCDEEPLLAHQPFVEALRHYVLACPPAKLVEQLRRGGGELRRLVPELAERVPDLAQPLAGDPAGERYRLFEAVSALLCEAAQARPVVLVLDDLHWADKPTLLLLRDVVRYRRQASLLVVGTYREAELQPGHPFTETLADLSREHRFERHRLRSLDRAAVERLVRHHTGHETPELSTRIFEETEGNPFFVVEMLRHLTESGVGVGIPEGVKDCLLYTSPSPRDRTRSRMPSSA